MLGRHTITASTHQIRACPNAALAVQKLQRPLKYREMRGLKAAFTEPIQEAGVLSKKGVGCQAGSSSAMFDGHGYPF